MHMKNFSIVENPQIRIPTIDAGRLKSNKTSMIGFLEVDITNLRKKIREYRKQSINFSFTSCMIKIISDTISANKHVQAALVNDRKLVLFDDVDLSISIERKLDKAYFPFPLIIRSANKKTLLEIDQEIKSETSKEIGNGNDLFMPDKPLLGKALLKFFYAIPSAVRVFIMGYIIKNPFRAKKVIGTIGFATDNITGRLTGWVFPSKNPHSLFIALGSVNKKPLVVNNEIQIRDVLNMSVIFDHNIIDGTPARNFMNSLVEKIEKGKIEIEYIKAPMPGKVIDVLVREGAPVLRGEPLVILEAMKMQNEIISPVNGIIVRINARPNTNVMKGDMLVEIKP